MSIEQMRAQQQCQLHNASGSMTSADANDVSTQCGAVESKWDVMD